MFQNVSKLKFHIAYSSSKVHYTLFPTTAYTTALSLSKLDLICVENSTTDTMNIWQMKQNNQKNVKNTLIVV